MQNLPVLKDVKNYTADQIKTLIAQLEEQMQNVTDLPTRAKLNKLIGSCIDVYCSKKLIVIPA